MADPRPHESPEQIEAYLAQCVAYARRLCLYPDESHQVAGLKLLRQLSRAHRKGRLPRGMRSAYEGLLRYVRPHVRAMADRGLTIPAAVDAELTRIHDEDRRPRPGHVPSDRPEPGRPR